MSQYDDKDINIAFPAYYTEIRPIAVEVKNKISEIKLNKDSIKGDIFEHFFNQAEILIKCVKDIDKHLPDIIKVQKRKKKIKQRELFFQIGISIFIALGFFILGMYVK